VNVSPDGLLKQFSELIGLPVRGVITHSPAPSLLHRMFGKEKNRFTVTWVPEPGAGWPTHGAFTPHILTAKETSQGWFIRVEAGGEFVISATDRVDKHAEDSRQMLMSLLAQGDIQAKLEFVKRVVTPRADGMEGFINRTTYRSSLGNIVLHMRGVEPGAQSMTEEVVVEFVSEGRYFRLNADKDPWLLELPF
jgi:hypothetical protein